MGCKDSEFFEGMGEYFVELATSIGYGDVLAVLGRQFKASISPLVMGSTINMSKGLRLFQLSEKKKIYISVINY